MAKKNMWSKVGRAKFCPSKNLLINYAKNKKISPLDNFSKEIPKNNKNMRLLETDCTALRLLQADTKNQNYSGTHC